MKIMLGAMSRKQKLRSLKLARTRAMAEEAAQDMV